MPAQRLATFLLHMVATLPLILGLVTESSSANDRLPLSPQGGCGPEPGFVYPSRLNRTAQLVCSVPRPERVCVVGGGASGLHMAWLLRRRGFLNTTVFERDEVLGGKIRTHPRQTAPFNNDPITRELGAAFLSPDYDEVGLLPTRHPATVTTRSHAADPF